MSFLENMAKKAARVRTIRWPRLPVLTTETAKVEAQFLGARSSVRYKIAGKVVTFTAPALVTNLLPLAVDVRFGETTLRVLVPEDVVGQLLALHGIEDTWQNYSPDTAAFVIEHLVADAVAPLESVSGGAFHILKVEPTATYGMGPNLPMEVNYGDTTLQIRVLAAPDLLVTWIVAMSDGSRQIEGLALSDLHFIARLYGPAFAIKAADVAELTVGEGFFLELPWDALFRAELIVADHLAATALLEHSGFHLTNELSQLKTLKAYEETSMSAITKTDISDIETLPVTVRIELAETTVTLADLQALTIGSVLPFADQLPTNVRLLANDRPIARGDLVQMDGKIAIRLTEVF